ncbi:MAG: hypothetical protein ACI89D_000168 [Bermanella sp.]|jgi:hypothetical protein
MIAIDWAATVINGILTAPSIAGIVVMGITDYLRVLAKTMVPIFT